jgi:hypothetical protein
MHTLLKKKLEINLCNGHTRNDHLYDISLREFYRRLKTSQWTVWRKPDDNTRCVEFYSLIGMHDVN